MSISAYTLKDGTTRYRVRFTKPDGTRTDERGFKNKAQAGKREAELKLGAAPKANEDPLRAFKPRLERRLSRRTPGTQDVYLKALDNHVIPAWGHRRASTISRQEVQSWIDNEGYGRSVATRNLSLLKQLLDCAGVDKADNPVSYIDKPDRARREKLYLSFDQLETLANCTRTRQHEILIYLLGTSGPRWGEAAGLRIKDLSPNDNTLHIWQSASVVRNEVVLGRPKNGKDRWISIPTFVKDMLQELTRGRAQNAPLFLSHDGGYLRRPKGRSWYDGAKKRANKIDQNIPTQLRIHDLRHTAASLMVSNGANIKVVQHQLGHATATETLDRYSDLFREDLSSATAAFDSLFSGGQDVGTGHFGRAV